MENDCGISNVALSSALRACGEALQWGKALELLHSASEPDAELFNARDTVKRSETI